MDMTAEGSGENPTLSMGKIHPHPPLLLWDNSHMDKLRQEITRRMAEKGLNPRSLSKKAGGSLTLIRDILEYRVRNPKHATLVNIARELGCTVAELTGDDGTPAPVGSSTAVLHPNALPGGAIYSAPDLPIVGTARGGLTGQGLPFDNGFTSLTRTYRPVYLVGVRNAYAVSIIGDSMEPALKHGRLAFVDPTRHPNPGDDVVIIQTTGEWFVKELVRRTERKVIVKQHNPPATVEYPTDKIEHIHLIVGTMRVEI